jgi:SAM-dependent methyltransferase
MSRSPLVLLARHILASSPLGPDFLALDTPAPVQGRMEEARKVVEAVGRIVRAAGHKTDYFESSMHRYQHYLAAALEAPKGARILEVGAAPGHVSIALTLSGYEPIGLNLNALWRDTYPSKEWLARLDVREHDVEKAPLPFEADSLDVVFFTEVLEHVAVTDPLGTMQEIRRVLKPDGLLIFSTPNVCNISNVLALMNGWNVFWAPEMFYGSLDRHNREYTPREVRDLFRRAGFERVTMYGINDHNNWRTGANMMAYEVLGALGDRHPLLRNTTVALARK